MQRLLGIYALTVLALFYTAWIELLATIKTCTSDHSNELIVANWQDIFMTEVHTGTGFIATILKTLVYHIIFKNVNKDASPLHLEVNLVTRCK